MCDIIVKNIRLNIQDKQQYELTDIIKFICAIFVIGIHTNIMSNSQNTFEWYVLHILFRISVPFFFMSSGFLFGKKYFTNKEKLKEICLKQEKRLLIPFIFWMLISLPYKIITTEGENIFAIVLNIVKQVIFYPWGALWFILALMISIGIEYIFLKKGKQKYTIFLVPILFGIALLGNSYYFILENTPLKNIMDAYLKLCISTRNGIFVGFPLFTVGVYMAKKEETILQMSKIKLYSFLILTLLIQICEVTFIRKHNYIDDHSIFITTIFVIAIILSICVKYRNIKFRKVNTKLLRNLSTGIYFMHRPIISYISLLNLNIGRWYVFFIVITISILLWFVLYKINNKYINYLIK